MKRLICSVMLASVLLLSGCSARFDANIPAISAAATLTREQARDLALKQAGLTADQVTGLHVEHDIDDGAPRYEVSFHYDGWEYDYEFSAETGALISSDRDKEIR